MSPRASQQVIAFHEKVANLCLDRLREALNPATQLFDRQLRDGKWADTLETEGVTSTAICLLGLHRAAIEPEHIGLDVRLTINAMVAAMHGLGYQGALGLVLWANAVWDRLPLATVLRRSKISFDRRPDELLAQLTTMETAWLLSGLVHEVERSDNGQADSMMEAAYAELLSRFQSDTRLFVHASDRAPVKQRMRKFVANFADQIYAVQALSFASITGADDAARVTAEGAAERLVELQGSLGQWWWHYDPRDGSVVQRFPVYSVHQHAMAPMALMALDAAAGSDHRAPIELSHRWIKENELDLDLLDQKQGTVWRDIELVEGKIERVVRHAKSMLGRKSKDRGTTVDCLKVNFETRPYEWAWCLFAGATASGHKMDPHVV